MRRSLLIIKNIMLSLKQDISRTTWVIIRFKRAIDDYGMKINAYTCYAKIHYNVMRFSLQRHYII
jgi:hypothetical protein